MANKCDDCVHCETCTFCEDMQKVMVVRESWLTDYAGTITAISEVLAEKCDHFST